MRSGQQCCYLASGELITNAPAGGTVDLVSPEINMLEHFIVDVIPSITCCLIPFANCELYYAKRPSDNGERYNPPPPGMLQRLQIIFHFISLIMTPIIAYCL